MTHIIYASDVLTIGLLVLVVILLISGGSQQYADCREGPLGLWLIVSNSSIILFRLLQFGFQWCATQPRDSLLRKYAARVTASLNLFLVFPFLCAWNIIGTIWFMQNHAADAELLRQTFGEEETAMTPSLLQTMRDQGKSSTAESDLRLCFRDENSRWSFLMWLALSDVFCLAFLLLLWVTFHETRRLRNLGRGREWRNYLSLEDGDVGMEGEEEDFRRILAALQRMHDLGIEPGALRTGLDPEEILQLPTEFLNESHFANPDTKGSDFPFDKLASSSSDTEGEEEEEEDGEEEVGGMDGRSSSGNDLDLGIPGLTTETPKHRKDKRNSTGSGERCSICVSELRIGDEVFVLGCRHLFHRDCLAQWLSHRGSCPNCRYRIGTSSSRDSLLY